MTRFATITSFLQRPLRLLGGAAILLCLGMVPSARGELVCSSSSATTVTLTWTAPSDAGSSSANRYEIRYSTAPITDQNWGLASLAPNIPNPQPSGDTQACVVPNLTPTTNYFFAMKSADSSLNWSPLSSVVARSTLSSDNSNRPSAVTDLSVSDSSTSTVVLQWTAPASSTGGNVSGYFVQYSTDSITVSKLSQVTRVLVPQTPKAPGQREQLTIHGLVDSEKYYFVIRSRNSNFMWSSLSNQASTNVLQPAARAANTFAYPNPFRTTEVPQVTFSSVPANSSLIIITPSGEPVKRWTNNSGADITWDGLNESGHAVATGIYLWYIEGTKMTGKLMVIR